MTCGNKEHEELVHACGLCKYWTIDIYFNQKCISEECKVCKEGDCRFIYHSK